MGGFVSNIVLVVLSDEKDVSMYEGTSKTSNSVYLTMSFFNYFCIPTQRMKNTENTEKYMQFCYFSHTRGGLSITWHWLSLF